MPEHLANGHIVKIGIVSHDAEATGAALRAIYPTVPTPERPARPASTAEPYLDYRGQRGQQNAQVKVVHVHTDNFWFEVIEPIDATPSAWRDHLEAHGTSVCFASIHVDQPIEGQVKVMEDLGFAPIWLQEKGFERYAYFDTAAVLGLLVEVKETNPR